MILYSIIYSFILLFFIFLIFYFKKNFFFTIKLLFLYIILYEIIRRLLPKDFLINPHYNSIGYYNFSGFSKTYDLLIIFLPLLVIYFSLIFKRIYEYKK